MLRLNFWLCAHLELLSTALSFYQFNMLLEIMGEGESPEVPTIQVKAARPVPDMPI